MKKLKVRTLTNEEYDNLYGERVVEVGKAFTNEKGHFYLQREKDVLHVGDGLINNLHVGFFNEDFREFEQISKEKFEEKLRETIFELGIYEYCK